MSKKRYVDFWDSAEGKRRTKEYGKLGKASASLLVTIVAMLWGFIKGIIRIFSLGLLFKSKPKARVKRRRR